MFTIYARITRTWFILLSYAQGIDMPVTGKLGFCFIKRLKSCQNNYVRLYAHLQIKKYLVSIYENLKLAIYDSNWEFLPAFAEGFG